VTRSNIYSQKCDTGVSQANIRPQSRRPGAHLQKMVEKGMSAGTCALTGAAREGGGAVFSTKNAEISKKIFDFLRNDGKGMSEQA